MQVQKDQVGWLWLIVVASPDGNCCMGTMNIFRPQPALEEFMYHLMYNSPHVHALVGPMKEMKARNIAYEREATEREGGTFNASEMAKDWVFVVYGYLSGQSDSATWHPGLEDPDVMISDTIAFCTENS